MQASHAGLGSLGMEAGKLGVLKNQVCGQKEIVQVRRHSLPRVDSPARSSPRRARGARDRF